MTVEGLPCCNEFWCDDADDDDDDEDEEEDEDGYYSDYCYFRIGD